MPSDVYAVTVIVRTEGTEAAAKRRLADAFAAVEIDGVLIVRRPAVETFAEIMLRVFGKKRDS